MKNKIPLTVLSRFELIKVLESWKRQLKPVIWKELDEQTYKQIRRLIINSFYKEYLADKLRENKMIYEKIVGKYKPINFNDDGIESPLKKINKMKKEKLLRWLDYFYGEARGDDKSIPPTFEAGEATEAYKEIRELLKSPNQNRRGKI